MDNNFDKDTRSTRSKNRSKKTKRKKSLRIFLLTLLIFILGTVGVGAYEYNKLNPINHFNNLKVIGTSASPKGSNVSNYKQKAGTFNVLLLGSDARPGETAGHSDSMLLIHVDMNTHQYNIISIPRDTRVYMNGYGYTKLTSVMYMSQANHGLKQGTIDAVDAVSNLTGVPINYYAETNYWGLSDMVDALGGVTVNVPFNVTFTHPWYGYDLNKTITKGSHFLNGKLVTELVHERYSLPGTDYGRQQLQEVALVGIAKEIMKPKNITKLPALSQSLSKFLIDTNMTTNDMVSIGIGVKNDFHPSQQIHYRQVKGTNEVMYNDILKANDDEVVMDPSQLKSVVEKYFKN